ncbi:MAG: class I SAM-dependent methyltransferase, partial [Rhizobiaceae bacterium]|nr:class I SAM-dependent methyltransferase [Rhizobiaceae bacterium]
SIKHTTYFKVYDALFSKYRGKEITFVEIGVLGGGSLFMWRDFFGPKARIIGVDLNPNARKWAEHGFEIFVGSQSDEGFWEDFCARVGPVDIVLDDGGHTYDQQITTAECLLENIRDGGMLVVEDTHTSYMQGFGPRKYSFVEYTKAMIDVINQRFNRFTDNPDHRVWAIEIYESIIAFKVNRRASTLVSRPTNNGAEFDRAKDFRYRDNTAVMNINRVEKTLKDYAFLPDLTAVFAFFRNVAVSRKFRSRKYFDRRAK